MNFVQVLASEAKLIFTDVAIVLTIIGGVILYSLLFTLFSTLSPMPKRVSLSFV